MKRLFSILFLLVTLSVFHIWGFERGTASLSGNPSVSADSILKRVIFYAPVYETLVSEYNAELYIKNRVYIRKRNFLIRYAPSVFRLKKNVREYLMESYSDLHFTAPNIFDQKTRACTGTVEGYRGQVGSNIEYFHVNIYSSTLLHSKLLSPLSQSAQKYYKYRLDSVITYKNDVAYRISFKPRKNSYQLVKGYMIVSKDVWSVRELQFSGNSEYMHYDNHIIMGDVGEDNEFLPTRFDLNTSFKLLGNHIDASYVATLDYKSIVLEEKKKHLKKLEKKNYDLTDSYTLQRDTTPYYTDTLHFSKLRPIELSPIEKNIYKDYYTSQDTTLFKPKKKTSSQVFWGNVGDILVDNNTYDLDQFGSIKTSPLFNPVLLNYSGKDGISYKQEFRYNRLFKRDRLLRIAPRIGYSFKRKEFYWRVKSDFDYWPHKRASLHLNIGNGNRIYSSLILEELKQIPDSVFDFDKIHLDYFNDFYVDLRHTLEIFNGFSVDIGISAHRRTAVKKSEFVPKDPDQDLSSMTEPPVDPELVEKFRNEYNSFAPRVRVSWTPGQYYYMSGHRKVNLHSDYPTFTLDWERGIKGIFGSTGSYERFEFDMQHKLSLGLMRTLYYRAGCGGYTKQKELYFVDYANFSKHNLPLGWNDDIGGVFQNLDRRWYNSSRQYVRANLTYEAPFLLLPLLFRNTKYVLNERLYFGALVVPHLKPYLEVGYGIGTHIFDVGVFVSNINGKFDEVGFKITFELFNR